MNYNTILPPFKWFVLENFPYIEDDFDALTNWQLFCKLGKEMNKIIEKCNLTGEQVENLTNAFNSLKAYIDNYFENLDVQDEIDNKLDEMAQDGTLAEIIAQYIQLNGVFAYDTKAEMKSAENLISGSICKTLGNLIYSDGQGAFYRVRQIQNTDVVDDENIIALSDPDLIAEKISYSSGYDIQTNLQNQIDSNYYLIRDLEDRLNEKLTICQDTYYPVNNIIGGKYGLSYEKITNHPSPMSMQGICYNKRTGTIYANDGTSIFTLTQGEPATKTVLYTIDLGHGGDCCIQGDYMLIADAIGNNIHKVNLTNGNDTIMSVPTSLITNPNTTGTPHVGGICINSVDEIFIAVIDEDDDNKVVAPNSTIRIYKYTDETHITKINEITNTSVYLQGFTMDNDNYYLICNKPLIDSGGVYYGGNNLYVINKFTNTLMDTLENTNDYEHEGLDYCGINGIEGLLTSIGVASFGLYAYFGNTTRTHVTESYTPHKKVITTISRGGEINVHVLWEDSFTGNQTYTFSHLLGLWSNKYGGVQNILFYGGGGSRSLICQAEYNTATDELKIYPSANMSKFEGCFSINGF